MILVTIIKLEKFYYGNFNNFTTSVRGYNAFQVIIFDECIQDFLKSFINNNDYIKVKGKIEIYQKPNGMILQLVVRDLNQIDFISMQEAYTLLKSLNNTSTTLKKNLNQISLNQQSTHTNLSLNNSQSSAINIGDKIQVTNSSHPKYLNIGTVVKYRSLPSGLLSLEVDFDGEKIEVKYIDVVYLGQNKSTSSVQNQSTNSSNGSKKKYEITEKLESIIILILIEIILCFFSFNFINKILPVIAEYDNLINSSQGFLWLFSIIMLGCLYCSILFFMGLPIICFWTYIKDEYF